MKRMIALAVTAGMIIIAVSLGGFFSVNKYSDKTGSYAVELNEIEQLCRHGKNEQAAEEAQALRKSIRGEKKQKTGFAVLINGGICLVFLTLITAYGCRAVILPFYRLSALAERLARGELDIPLEYERTNYFGKFTWAFDSMRNEIKKARICEREAIDNNKTVIASLSHDIKTPVASIRAYAEALELGMDSDPEKRARFIGVIINKCDEVSKLTEDMLTHSLSDLQKLNMKAEKLELTEFLQETLEELEAGRNDIIYERPLFSVTVEADKMRLAQVVENLINNARKYAKSEIRVSVTRSEDMVAMHFRDYGSGIADEDLPFIWKKFYRGKNSTSEKGAGLGLFIVKYIAERSGGRAELKNVGDGLKVTVQLPVAEE